MVSIDRLIRSFSILALLVLAPAHAQESGAQADKPAAEKKAAVSESKQDKSSPASRPARSFTPSEKIRADTSVAFPADI